MRKSKVYTLLDYIGNEYLDFDSLDTLQSVALKRISEYENEDKGLFLTIRYKGVYGRNYIYEIVEEN